ncbi:hypothetical protein [Proteiniclasticum sp. QWL-01]|uniref:hypothetical protein n=1 Tax=Proteiniclasticum sp. QWL-01 TaxID=3036945 RepID=UPI00240F8088|nr:hypothetical protein [Proteiniclasticum sp. QWL-01]WFF72761.1 hypothetical protein P6M73_16045 [Proteiniclasticum sp. QWL-01]
MEYPDINTKINDVFVMPVTEELTRKWGEALKSEQRIEQILNRELLPRLLEYVRTSEPRFEGRFVVTKVGDVIKGQFQSQSVVKSSLDQAVLDHLNQLLREFSGSPLAQAEINLNCFL